MLGRSEKSTQKRDSIFHHPITKAVTKKKKNLGHPDGPQSSKELAHTKIRDQQKNVSPRLLTRQSRVTKTKSKSDSHIIKHHGFQNHHIITITINFLKLECVGRIS
jgi:hypothetical protein